MLDELQRLLATKECELIGCPRQNRWIPEYRQTWRYWRGNALLAHLGYKVRVQVPFGEFDVFYRPQEMTVLQFRGGPWKPWWEEDLQLFGALCQMYLNGEIRRVTVLHEVDNILGIRYVEVPPHPEGLVQRALESWRESGRIQKNSPRAYSYCVHCPVARQCDAADLQSGDTSDWPLDKKVT